MRPATLYALDTFIELNEALVAHYGIHPFSMPGPDVARDDVAKMLDLAGIQVKSNLRIIKSLLAYVEVLEADRDAAQAVINGQAEAIGRTLEDYPDS